MEQEIDSFQVAVVPTFHCAGEGGANESVSHYCETKTRIEIFDLVSPSTLELSSYSSQQV